MLGSLVGLLTLQNCTKSGSPTEEFVAAMPGTPVPAVNTIIPYVDASQTVNLTWAGSGTSTPKWTVYFGKSSNPPVVASNVSTNAYTASTPVGGVYYWKVETKDANNIITTSDVWSFDVNSNPGAAFNPVPATAATAVSCSPTLYWSCTDPESDALTYDLILDKNASPSTVVATGVSDTSFTMTTLLDQSTTYYWKIVAHDPYGGISTSPVWSFTTGLLPIAKYSGNYTVDEPAEGWSYDVTFVVTSATTIKIGTGSGTYDGWWASWPATYTLNLTNLTYSMPYQTFTSGYAGAESGILDPSTGTMTGTYTVWHNGSIAEQGTHTYTKH